MLLLCIVLPILVYWAVYQFYGVANTYTVLSHIWAAEWFDIIVELLGFLPLFPCLITTPNWPELFCVNAQYRI